ncbi:MAG: hypothetical protein EPO07_20045 [Verrucomicrobia bacterium]|nr:MAG: hypothetical protein EPO07_20045 [Verrucomicrobiota bacterium]
MNFLSRAILVVYMALGLGTSACIDGARARGWSLKVASGMFFAHIVMASVALIIAASSKPTQAGYRLGFSPGAWLFGAGASYAVGFTVFWFVK